MNFGAALSNIAVGIAIVGAVGLIVAYLRSDVTRKTVIQLKELADALDMRVKVLEDEKETLVARIGLLEEENQVLRSLLDGTKTTEDLRVQMERNHLEIISLFTGTIDKFERLITDR